MHSPQFSTGQRLSGWLERMLEIRCPRSLRVVLLPVKFFLERGNRTFDDVPLALGCMACSTRSAGSQPSGRWAEPET